MPTRRPRAAGLRLGSARLDRPVRDRTTRRPPRRSLRCGVAAAEAVRGAPDARRREIVAVGGTASNLLKVLPEAIADRILTRERIAADQAILATEPPAAASERHGINPIRARLLPAGARSWTRILDRYGAATIRVSEAGLARAPSWPSTTPGRAGATDWPSSPTAGER